MAKKISIYAGAVLAICSVIGVLFAVDNYVAKAEDVRQLSLRLEQKIQQDAARDLQNRIWMLEDRYNGKPCPPHVLAEIRRLKEDLQSVNKEIDHLRRGKQ